MMAAILALGIVQESERVPRTIIKPARFNCFNNLADVEFVKNFRLTKNLTRQLINELQQHLQPLTTRENDISVEAKVLCALRFFASGAYQRNISNDYMIGVSQQSASNCIRQVVDVINRELLKKYVKFPTDIRDQELTKREFFESCGISGIIGAIDCTHVSIIAPSDDGFHNERNYVNRKGWHSLNVQIVCDMNLRITDIVSRFPGCSHDAYIWKSSNLRKCFQTRGFIRGNGWLLGDSGYPLEPFLHIPFTNPNNQRKKAYNDKHAKGRCVIERVNGVLKSRFRCLSKERVLHYEPEVAGLIINACAVLHNMCINSTLTWEEEIDLDEDDLPFNTPSNM